MSKTTNDAISRSDRVLVTAMSIILATASAAVGASLTYHPHQDKVAVIAVAPVAELERLDHPWVQSYFNGPRGRAARVSGGHDASGRIGLVGDPSIQGS